jgi:hypothetical protein
MPSQAPGQPPGQPPGNEEFDPSVPNRAQDSGLPGGPYTANEPDQPPPWYSPDGQQGDGQKGANADSDYIASHGGHSTLGGVNQQGIKGLNPELGKRLAAAGRAYTAATGRQPTFGEGYRDDATQQKYWHERGDRFDPKHPAARPVAYGGRGSNHLRGNAMDLNQDPGFRSWLHQNGQRYGLHFPVPNDPGHVQMTGQMRGASSTPGAGGHGVSPYAEKAISIESDWKGSRTGSNRGLAQFDPELERKYGLNSRNRNDPQAAARALQMEQQEMQPKLSQALGREPTDAEYYIAHQQRAGAPALFRAARDSPGTPAWQVIRPFYGSDAMARQAIGGNVPGINRIQAANMTADQFVRFWQDRFGGI